MDKPIRGLTTRLTWPLTLALEETNTKPSGGVPIPKTSNLFPVNGNEVWIRTLGVDVPALGFRFKRNLGTTTTSIGSPWQPYRRTGVVELATPETAPTSPTFVYSDEDGAQDYAWQRGTIFIYGGSYHGGETVVSEEFYGDGVELDPTVAAQFNVFELIRTTLITWGDATTMTIVYHLTIDATGVVTETMSATSTASFATQYPQMEMPRQAAFAQAIVGATSYFNKGANVDIETAGTQHVFRFRSPKTGHLVDMDSDFPGKPTYSKTYIERASGRNKLYVQKASTAGGAFGTLTTNRTIVYGKGVSDIFYWSGATDGLTGWSKVTGFNESAIALTNNQLVLTRATGTGTARVVFPVTGLTIGQAYTLIGDIEIVGASPSAGTTVSLSANSNGSSAAALGNASAGGAVNFAISGAAVTATTMYITLNQVQAAASDNVFKLNNWRIARP